MNNGAFVNSRRKRRGNILIEAVIGFTLLIPLGLFAADVVVMTHTAQVNEEFAESLARLCATLMTQDNAYKACQDVIKLYAPPNNVTSVNLEYLTFDVGLRKVTIDTSMTYTLPVPIPGQNKAQVVEANVTQPIVSFPAPR